MKKALLLLTLLLPAAAHAEVSYGTNVAHVTTNGALKVDGSEAVQPVSCVSGCSGSAATGVSTITYNGIAQPVNVQNFPSSQAVTGTFFQSVQPVFLNNVGTTTISGTVPVSGTFWQNTQPVSGSLSVSNFPATQPVSGTFWQNTQPVSGSLSVSNFPASQSVYVTNPTTTTITGTVPVSGTFFQATQPVSLASMPSTPVTGTFWQATQPISGTVSVGNFPASQTVAGTVSVGNFPATQPVSIASMPSTPVTGTFWQATQPVSIASMPSTPVTGTFWQATQPVSGSVSVSNFPASQAVTGTFWQATQPISGTVTELPTSAPLWVTATGAAAAGVTATLPAVSAQFHYITFIEVEAYSTVARTGGTTPVLVTTTNMPGSPVYTFATAAAVGTTDTKTYILTQPIKSSVVNTATTIVCPATASIIWRVNVAYYAGT